MTVVTYMWGGMIDLSKRQQNTSNEWTKHTQTYFENQGISDCARV